MKHMRFVAFALALLIGGGLGMAAADQGFVENTSAAWTDQTQVSAIVTAGAWQTTSKNTCIAYGFDGEQLAGCEVASITFDVWGTAGNQVRNYYLNFNVDPSKVRRVSFDVDLSTATGTKTSWSWEKAGVRSGAQFTPRDGWSCADFPRVRGTGVDWQRPGIFFVVDENSTGQSTMCS